MSLLVSPLIVAAVSSVNAPSPKAIVRLATSLLLAWFVAMPVSVSVNSVRAVFRA